MFLVAFVGMFIARVSRGRRLREFLICVLNHPVGRLQCCGMAVFGGTAIKEMIANPDTRR